MHGIVLGEIILKPVPGRDYLLLNRAINASEDLGGWGIKTAREAIGYLQAWLQEQEAEATTREAQRAANRARAQTCSHYAARWTWWKDAPHRPWGYWLLCCVCQKPLRDSDELGAQECWQPVLRRRLLPEEQQKFQGPHHQEAITAVWQEDAIPGPQWRTEER